MSQTKVTRSNPACIMLLVDKSGSMAEKLTFNEQLMTKSQAVSIIINSFIDELLYRCRKGGSYMNYFEVALLGYSDNKTYSMLESLDSDRITFTVPDLTNANVDKYSISKRRIGSDGLYYTHTTTINKCIDHTDGGNTPMKQALLELYKHANQWIQKNKDRYTIPPILIHISDGEATDSETPTLLKIADKIKSLSIGGGKVTFMNVNISSMHKESIIFPSSSLELPKENTTAKLLYDMSSTLSKEYAESISYIKDKELSTFDASIPVKAMAYNASLNELIGILSIGTSTISG